MNKHPLIKCDICNDMRHHEFINEITHNIGLLEGFDNDNDVKRTLKYCGDKLICKVFAEMNICLKKLSRK